jgi:hypothetical protein
LEIAWSELDWTLRLTFAPNVMIEPPAAESEIPAVGSRLRHFGREYLGAGTAIRLDGDDRGPRVRPRPPCSGSFWAPYAARLYPS